MKRLSYLFGVVCLIALLLPACAPAPEPEPEAAPEPVFDQAAEESAIREMMKQREVAFNQHDAKALAAQHVENWENWPGTLKGRAAYENDRSERYEGQKNGKRNLLNEIGIIFVTPEVAIYKVRMEYTGWVDADGKTEPPAKRLVPRVLVKKQGQWLIAAAFGRPVEE